MMRLRHFRLRDYLTVAGLTRPLSQQGIQNDLGANFGYFELHRNAGNYCGTYNAAATSGTNITLTAAQVVTSRVLRLTSGASAGFTITLPSTVALLAALGRTVVVDGSYAQPFIIMNDNIGQTGTLTAGDASTTITGTATIATNVSRMYMLQVTTANTLTFFNIGSMTV